ncbi:hypothetical protein BCY91_13985 [Pelobium manganitolerans]|uniref:Uncharacterized protein n=1 Tax=Pelobium manganitolerans TaxID=1842495 RepID=A0A419S9S9_9SPHI|nr:hypothetical protein [Pelobium manganitolerans]RKD18982.1 hypothetical protein BCY91_13985 [Pelobium manganitolerans]
MANLHKILQVPANLTDDSIKSAKESINEQIKSMDKWCIRTAFNMALMDTQQLAAIQIAKDRGYDDLAIAMLKEMEVQNA